MRLSGSFEHKRRHAKPIVALILGQVVTSFATFKVYKQSEFGQTGTRRVSRAVCALLPAVRNPHVYERYMFDPC